MYTKLYSKILDSSIWLEPLHVRVVWISMLAASNMDGFVQSSSAQNLANRANVSLEQCLDAIRVFTSDDADSGDPENDGRRIERVPGGFMILNYEKYKNIISRERDLEMNRARVKAFREKKQAAKVQAPFVEEQLPNVDVPSQPEKKPSTDHYHPDSRSALHILNESSGKTFREVDSNLSRISERLNEPGVDLEGVRTMIVRQCKCWKDTNMAEYLRPETLFGKQKFDSYYAARHQPIQKSSGGNGQSARPNHRNEGIVEGPTDYAAAGERRMRESRELAERMDREVASPPAPSPVAQVGL